MLVSHFFDLVPIWVLHLMVMQTGCWFLMKKASWSMVTN